MELKLISLALMAIAMALTFCAVPVQADFTTSVWVGVYYPRKLYANTPGMVEITFIGSHGEETGHIDLVMYNHRVYDRIVRRYGTAPIFIVEIPAGIVHVWASFPVTGPDVTVFVGISGGYYGYNRYLEVHLISSS